MSDKPKALHLFSGGLDSLLSARIIQREGFEVTALHFYNGFNDQVKLEVAGGAGWKWQPAESLRTSAEQLGLILRPLDVSDEFLDILLHPRFGYGSGANPCIDCRIFILNKAREIMEDEGFEFIVSGEVIGQRPMSQRKNVMRQVEKNSGLDGRLLRPLSARHLHPTIPEQEGIVNRDHLYGIIGRSRKTQQRLAQELDIESYPQPAGGCVLTDPSFGKRFSDLLAHTPSERITRRELDSLKAGRHFRLPSGIKVIVGRNEAENNYLSDLFGSTYWRFEAVDVTGPLVFTIPHPAGDDFDVTAAITARYGKGKREPEVTVQAVRGNTSHIFTVAPASPEDIDRYRID